MCGFQSSNIEFEMAELGRQRARKTERERERERRKGMCLNV